jgi:glycerol-3-phosphate acyltransferase PlsY
MSPALIIPIALAAAYVVGSIDFAVIVARMHGVDIHTAGSGNPGTSNVLRTLGKFPAAMVFIGDTLKGTVGAAMGLFASAIADPLMVPPHVPVEEVHLVFAAGFCAVLGHCYPVFHKFKGGKGVATGGGVLLFGAPLVMLIDFILWAVIVKLTKTASIGSLILVVVTVPLLLWQGVTGWSMVWMILTIVLIVWRHKGNIQRMARGSEERVRV